MAHFIKKVPTPIISGSNNIFTKLDGKTVRTSDIIIENSLTLLSDKTKEITPTFNATVLSPNRNDTTSSIGNSGFYETSVADIQNYIINYDFSEDVLPDIKQIFARTLQTESVENITKIFEALESYDNATVLMLLFLVYNENFSIRDILVDLASVDMMGKDDNGYSNIHFLTDIFRANCIPIHSNHLLSVIPSVYTTETDEHPLAYQDAENIASEFDRIYSAAGGNELDFASFVKIAAGIDISLSPETFMRINDSNSTCDENIWFFSYLYNFSKESYSQEQAFINKVKKHRMYKTEYDKYFKFFGYTIPDDFSNYAELFRKLMGMLSRRTINY